jgi:hypothetical protein
MVMMLVPNLEMVSRVCRLAPSPIEIIEITDATPIIIPNAVKNVLSLWVTRLLRAILNKSHISTVPSP